MPTAGALRADAAPRFARVARRHFSALRTPQPHARAAVLLAARARTHVRVQFAAGPARNCVLEAPGRFAILNAVAVMLRAMRGTGAAGVGHGRAPHWRA
ncbi:hypothetical protein CN645_37455, partial [Burkholderia sp. IDO3]